jgi:phosphoglycerate dehydrogenase-like enzyme
VTLTALISEHMYPDIAQEEAILGPRARVLRGAPVASIAELPQADCDAADGLFLFRMWFGRDEIARFPKLRVVVRMGVGYDRVDRAECARRGITLCNIPDYGTAEVADHAIALALALRRGLTLHHDAQRGVGRNQPAPWVYMEHPLIRRQEQLTFGVLGLGRIGTAAALRAKAFGQRVIFYDPHLPNGVDRALGITRVRSLAELMAQSDTVSIHAPLTPETRGLVDAAAISAMKPGSLIINTARGPIVDLDALTDALLDGHLGGAGLDVLPIEPPPEPPHPLIAAYRAADPRLAGRLIVTPHSAFHTPEAWADTRRLAAETMRDVLLDGLATNVIPPPG